MSKVAVITGAGAGVGRATAEEFARQGYDVALLVARSRAGSSGRRRRCVAMGVRALPIPTDVADAAAVEAAAGARGSRARTDRRLGQCRDGDGIRACAN